MPATKFIKNKVLIVGEVLQNCKAYKIVAQFVVFCVIGVYLITTDSRGEVTGMTDILSLYTDTSQLLLLTNMTVQGYS